MYMNDGNKTKINLRNKSVFITGVAGFIGSNLAKRCVKQCTLPQRRKHSFLTRVTPENASQEWLKWLRKVKLHRMRR